MRAPGKFVIVSQYYAPDQSTTSTYMTAIANGLRTVRDVLVICGTPDSASLAQAESGRPAVTEIRTCNPEKDALARRAIAMVFLTLKMFFATYKSVTKDDVVLCVTSPFTLPYGVVLAAKFRRASAALVIYDLYPEALIMAGLVKPTSFIARSIRIANGFLFGALDSIITIGRDVEALLLTYKSLGNRQKIKFIPNWALLPIEYRESSVDNIFRSKFGDKLVVGLSGNLGFTHCPRTVYEAARLLQDETKVHFLLSGWGSGWQQLKELNATAPLSNVTLIDPVSESELEQFLSAADVWIIPYRRNIAGVSVPSRAYNLLAVGRPIIVASEANSEAALMLKEDDIGWVVKPEDALELSETIRSAAFDRAETLAKGRRAALAARRYTADHAIASYRKIMSELMFNRS